MVGLEWIRGGVLMGLGGMGLKKVIGELARCVLRTS